MVCGVVAGIQESLQQKQTQTETPTSVQVPLDHVANAVQITQQQLATQLQQMQLMMQTMKMHYNAAPHGTRQECGGRGYHGNQSSYPGRGGRGSQNNGNCHTGCGGRVNSNLTRYCWKHGMCDHPGKYCSTQADGHQKVAVWFNKMSVSERNFTWQVSSIPANKNNVE